MGPALSDLYAHGSGQFGTLQSVILDQFKGAEDNAKYICFVISNVSLLLG